MDADGSLALTHPKHVALIGCGFTGTSALVQLVERYPVEKITVFEASGRFGPGFPYQATESRDYLLNNKTNTMCLTPSNRRAFVEWLRSRPELVPELEEDGYLPRSLYGAFLTEAFRKCRTTAADKGIAVELVPEEATRLREDGVGRVHIGWANGETVADMAVLTTGRCPDIDPYPHPPAGSSARYFPHHVMTPELDAIPLDATVHVLGASLSAYDVVNRLFAPGTDCRFARGGDGELHFEDGANQRRVVLCSRSGRLKAAQSRVPMELHRQHFTDAELEKVARRGGTTLETVADIVCTEAQAHGAEMQWHAVVDPYAGCRSARELNTRARALLEGAINAARQRGADNFLVDFFHEAQTTLWDGFAQGALTPDEEARYRSRFETGVLSYVAPCPIVTAERLLALARAERLRVVAGVRSVELDTNGEAYVIPHGFGVESASIVVNTTGSVDRDVTSPRQPPLVRDLVANGLLAPHERDGQVMPGAAVDMTTMRAHGARNVYVANMMLWGPGFFTSSAFTMATVVQRLLDSAFSTRGDRTPPR